METFENARIKIFTKKEKYSPTLIMKEDFIFQIIGRNQLKVIKDRTGIFTKSNTKI